MLEWTYGAIEQFNTYYGLGLILNWSGSAIVIADLITIGDKEMTLLNLRNGLLIGGKDMVSIGVKDMSGIADKDIIHIGRKDI